MNLFEQLESWSYNHNKRVRRSRFIKIAKHRVERHRANINPECIPCYRKYRGWEW